MFITRRLPKMSEGAWRSAAAIAVSVIVVGAVAGIFVGRTRIFSGSTPQRTPQTLNDFIQQRGVGPTPLTTEEWCELAFLAVTSPQANEQTRNEIGMLARNRGCYREAKPYENEAVRVMVCKNIPAQLSDPANSSLQKLAIMDMARANKCIR